MSTDILMVLNLLPCTSFVPGQSFCEQLLNLGI